MNSIHYSLSSNVYKNNIFAGFSQLQKQEEFVDLTLAADGCIVKVHRNLIALASPYLRDILRSMSNHSPVLFLNNVSEKVLSYILEYIYQGEVNIPVDSVDAFIEVSKSLHIAGIEDLEPPKMKLPRKFTENKRTPPERRYSNVAGHIAINSGSMEVGTKGLMEVHSNQSDELENNDNYGTDYSMNDPQQSAEIINNANFIIQQNQESCNNEMLHNLALVEMETENSQLNTHSNTHNYLNLLQSQTGSQSENIETNHDIPGISSDRADQHVQTNTTQFNDYKIIVKTQNDMDRADNTETLQNNIPVIEIQHFGSTVQEDQNTNFHEYMPAQTNNEAQAFQYNHDLSVETSSTQNWSKQAISKHKSPIIKVLDDIIIKSGSLPEMNIGSVQIPLDGIEGTGALISDHKVNMNDMKNMPQFSVTERGALQLILNRYLYCCHHSTRQKQRWRCIEYRRGRCLAIVDTVQGAIVARKGMHAHPFHDKKIYAKHKKGLIYHTVGLALDARDSAQKEGLRTLSNDGTDGDDDK